MGSTTQAKADIAEIKRALSVFFTPGDVVELRALDVRGKTYAGYFSNYQKLANEAAKLSGNAAGVYAVLNRINPELLARSANRITLAPKNLTQDSDVTRRLWLPIDIDARRPKGISSTDAEHEVALATAKAVKTYLIEIGFPADSIVVGDSGNGAHVLTRIDLPNDAGTTALVEACIKALAAKFDNDKVTIDKSVFNAARIWKLPGTLARKGDSTTDRPHRIARLLDVPATISIAPMEPVKALAATMPELEAPRQASRTYQGTGQTFDLETWLDKNGIEVKTSGPYEGGTRYILKVCPFNPEHTGTSVAIFKTVDGALGFRCQHDGCHDKKWADLRELLEPNYRTRRGEPGAVNSDPVDFRLTDTGNAEFLADLFGHRIRYDHRRHRWLLWEHHHWCPDRDGHIARLAGEAARIRYSRAETITDLKQRQAVAHWAIGSESRMRLDASTSLARNIRPIADSGENWDRDVWLLGVSNGVVDLRTGELRPGRLDDRITMSTGVQFDSEAKCPRWKQFLNEVFGDDELIAWLSRALGYSVSGDTTEQCIFIGHGRGANGKTKFNEAIRAALGDYSHSSPFSTFELYQRAAIPNDLAALEFKRFVTSSETNDNTRLNEARVKAISGGDPITARYLHAEFFTFMPHLKLWLFVNHKPKVVDDSHGFWRRVRLIPFIRQFSGEAEDKKLGETLRVEAPGILSWLVRGCLEWQKRGLEPVPEVVKVATQEYKEESDALAGFISDRGVQDANATIKASDLYNEYKNWAVEQGMREKEILTSTAFGRRMRDKFSKEKRGGTVYYFGIGLPGQLQDSFEANVTQNDVFPICNDSRVITRKTILNCPDEAKTGQNCPAIRDNHLETLLGMPVEKAIEVWRSEGAPVIHLGPGVNCSDLGKLLSQTDISPEHLDAVKAWLKKHGGYGCGGQ